GGAGAAVAEHGAVDPAVAVFPGGEDPDADASDVRRDRRQRPLSQLGAALSGAAPARPSHGAGHLSRPGARSDPAELRAGPLRALPGLVRPVFESKTPEAAEAVEAAG